MIDQVIGSYRVVAKIGEGGMGAVYRAEHTMLGRVAALKVLLPQLSQNQDIVRRFFNEAKAASAIRHLGIVEIYDFGFHTDGSAYLVMAYLDGESLEQRLARVGRLPVAHAINIASQIAGALAAAHAQRIVHRDLKPDNAFLVPDPETATGERIQLLDFGIAKLAAGDAVGSRTRTGALMGTPAYMSPEQCRGASDIDHRADLYALGCILFRALCGREPFVGEFAGDILASHMRDPAPAPGSLAPDVPAELDALVLRLLEKDPARRPQSADEVRAALRALGAAATLAPGSGLAGAAAAVSLGLAPTVPPDALGSASAPPAGVTPAGPAAGPRAPTPAGIATPAPVRSAAPSAAGGATPHAAEVVATPSAPSAVAAPSAAGRRWVAPVAALAVVVVLGGGLAAMLGGGAGEPAAVAGRDAADASAPRREARVRPVPVAPARDARTPAPDDAASPGPPVDAGPGGDAAEARPAPEPRRPAPRPERPPPRPAPRPEPERPPPEPPDPEPSGPEPPEPELPDPGPRPRGLTRIRLARVEVFGGVDRRRVERAVERRLPRIQRCAPRARDVSAPVQISVELELDDTRRGGSVTARSRGGAVPARVEQCIERVLSGARISPFATGLVRARIVLAIAPP